LYPPDAKSHGKTPSTEGDDVRAIKRAVSRGGRWPWGTFDGLFSNGFSHGTSGNVVESGMAGLQRQNGIEPTGWMGEMTYNLIRSARIPQGLPNAGEPLLDQVAVDMLVAYEKSLQPAMPSLGPVWSGGWSVLEHDLTHATSGIPLYPAFDDAFVQGRTIIAPEEIKVTRASSSNPGDAFYADGKSGLRYWFGHLSVAPPVGAKIAKGGYIGETCANSEGGGPHVHVGVNVERLWGAGKEMAHHTNYTHGAPTIGDQLATHGK
jgi:hypothetical protein